MREWTIGGVPEHFNLPWRDVVAARSPSRAATAAERGDGTSRPLVWKSFPGGTGAMIEALEDGTLDIAILLTEGAVAGQARGGTYRIVSNYVTSPLIWGVHVAPASEYRSVNALGGARFAVSRFGSGSHLMAVALADRQGWILSDSQFVVVGSLDGAVEAFAHGRADVFMWEHFMTRPLVDRGVFRRLDDFTAPWSAFVTCARAELAGDDAGELRMLLEQVAETARRFSTDAGTPGRLFGEFGIDAEQALRWLDSTRWADVLDVPVKDIEAARDMLRRAGMVAG